MAEQRRSVMPGLGSQADDEGSVVNPQVEYFIRQSGGQIIAGIAGLAAALNS